MPSTPLNAFGRSGDAERLARLAHDALPGSTIERDGNGFVVTATARRRRLGRSGPPPLVVRVDPEHFDGEDGRRQQLGMANFLGGAMGGPGVEAVIGSIGELRMAVALIPDERISPHPGDPFFALALRLTEAIDGFLLGLDDGCVWSGAGHVLASLDGEPPLDPARRDHDIHEEEEVDEEDDGVEPDPPTVDRVRARLVALTAVAARAIEDDSEAAADAREGILGWVDALGCGAELEPEELDLLRTSPGALDDQERVNACWRFEGAVVLAWSLGLLDLPRYDELVTPADLGASLGFPDADATHAVLAAARLRPATEIEALAAQTFAIHWRLRDQYLNPRAFDFAEFATTAWFGPLDLSSARLIDGDLAIGDAPIADADPDLFHRTLSAVSERHIGVNWLVGGGRYSETDNST